MKFIFPVFIVVILFSYCNRQSGDIIRITGEAQGTTYQLTWLSETGIDYNSAIDSILKVIDLSLSTYVPSSIISRINRNDTSVILDDHFIQVFNKAQDVSEKTNGLFDVTVAPLINAWGFGFTNKAAVDSIMIDSLLTFTGYDLVRMDGRQLVKEKPQVMLDFNAIAQGYTVDVLASFLESKGINNYMVELGGEIKTKGKKQKNKYWTVGIDQPNETPADGRPLKAIIQMRDRGLATSGNYRKFYIANGEKRAHIIDPHTGYPAKHNLLSATVLAPDCMTADAYATAFMVMGMNEVKHFLFGHPELQLDVFFIYDEKGSWKTYSSGKLKKMLEEIP